MFSAETAGLARPGWTTTRRCAEHVLRRLAIDRMTVAAIAGVLGCPWDTVNAIAVTATGTAPADRLAARDQDFRDRVEVVVTASFRLAFVDVRLGPRCGGHLATAPSSGPTTWKLGLRSGRSGNRGSALA